MKSKLMCMFVLVGATACLIAAPAGAGSSKKVLMNNVGKANGTALTGKLSGAPFGKGTFTGTVNFQTGKTVQKWTVKGGTFVMTSTGKLSGGTISKGPWKFAKGTGKFKKIKGSGQATGDVVTGKYKYTGKVTY